MKIYSLILMVLFLNGDHILHDSKDFQVEFEWELKKEKNDIKVYIRESAGSSINEVRVVASVKASIEELVEVVYDIDSYPEWVSNMKSAEILETVSKREIYYYFEAEVPWPFSNRDDVMRFTMEENSKTGGVTINFTGNPDYIPEKKKIVRLRKNQGHWKFTPMKNGKTEIDYQFLTDPGKGNPGWLVNMFIVDGPYETIENLKEYLYPGK